MAVTLKQLEALVAVVELSSFRRAADRLATTQPNISTRIAALEERLGGPLLIRDGGKVRLTALGEAMLPRARRALGAVDDMLAAAPNHALAEGTLRLGVTELVAHTWLGAFLSALKARYPRLLPDLTIDVSAQISAALETRALDLAIQNAPFPVAVSGNVPLHTAPFAWVAPAGSPLAGRPLTLADIAAEPLLTPARGTPPHGEVLAALDALALPARVVPSSNMTASLQLAADGFGIACVPVALLADPHAGPLTRLDVDWHPAPLAFHARFDADNAPYFVAEAAQIAAHVAQSINFSDVDDPIK